MFEYEELKKDPKLKHMEDEDLIYVFDKVKAVKEEQENQDEKKKKEEMKQAK